MLTSNSLLAVACVAAAAVNIFIISSQKTQPLYPAIEHSDSNYSYVGDDHPIYLMSFDDIPRVALDFEESVHYGLGEHAFRDWEDIPIAHVQYKVGPKYRAFVVSNSHIRHCMIRFHRALYPGLSSEKMLHGHTQHCLAYMRQMVLCNADLTLEPPDVLDRDWEVARTGATHVCKDWSKAQSFASELSEQWQQFKMQMFSDV